MLKGFTMKTLFLCFVLVICSDAVFSVKDVDDCKYCVPREKCTMFIEMNAREEEQWVRDHPCDSPGTEDQGPLFGFSSVAKGDKVCCPIYIWGVDAHGLHNRFEEKESNSPPSREIYSDDGYNQDNLHKKQNSNINKEHYGDSGEVSYEKQNSRSPARRGNRPIIPVNNNFGRGPRNNFNQPIMQGFHPTLPVFGANGMPITNNGPNFNSNNIGPQIRPVNNGFEANRPINSIVNNGKQCRISVLPPNSDSGCCGMDIEADRMFSANTNFINRPANPNFRPWNSNIQQSNTNFRPSSTNFRPPTSSSWAGPYGAEASASGPTYPRRFTRETPEELGISLDNRIAGGKVTELYQFPWTVLLKATFDYGNRQGTFNCGGSLISSRYVLTAAHCVTEPNAKIKNIDIYLAEYDKRTFPRDCVNSPEGRKCIDNVLVKAEDVQVHPHYDNDRLQSDIALIRLRENVPYTDFIRPICLPPINIDNPEYSNLRLAVAGWGRNGSVNPSELKQSTVVNLVPQGECSHSYPQLSKQHVCAAGHSGEDTCKGDSGGPLMMLYEGKYYVSGIVSGKRADSPCGTSVPSLYTNVYQFLAWIRQTLRE